MAVHAIAVGAACSSQERRIVEALESAAVDHCQGDSPEPSAAGNSLVNCATVVVDAGVVAAVDTGIAGTEKEDHWRWDRDSRQHRRGSDSLPRLGRGRVPTAAYS